MEAELEHYKALAAQSLLEREASDARWKELIDTERKAKHNAERDTQLARSRVETLTLTTSSLQQRNRTLVEEVRRLSTGRDEETLRLRGEQEEEMKRLRSEHEEQIKAFEEEKVTQRHERERLEAALAKANAEIKQLTDMYGGEDNVLLQNLKKATSDLYHELILRNHDLSALLSMYVDAESNFLVSAHIERPEQFATLRAAESPMACRLSDMVAIIHPGTAFVDAVIAVVALGVPITIAPTIDAHPDSGAAVEPTPENIRRAFELFYSTNLIRLGFLPESGDVRYLPGMEAYMTNGDAERSREPVEAGVEVGRFVHAADLDQAAWNDMFGIGKGVVGGVWAAG